MFEQESSCHADSITGSYLWAGSPADVFAAQRMTQQARRDKAKPREYRWKITVEHMAVAQARLQDLDLVAQRRKKHALNPVGRGRGMIHWADKYLARQHGKEVEWIPGTVPTLPVLQDRAVSPDDYHSAREPSEFKYDTEETDPEGMEDDPKEDDASADSDSTHRSGGHDMNRTRRSNTTNRHQRRNQRKRQGRRPTNGRKEEDRHKGKVVLSLFWDSPMEGALTYTD